MIIWDRQTVLWWELALFPKEDMHLHLQQKCVTHTHIQHVSNTNKNTTYHTKQWHISHTHTITDRQQHKPVILLQYSHLFWLDICRTFYTWWNRKDPIAKPTNQFQRERGKNSGTTTTVEDTRSHVLVDTCAPAATQRSWRRDQELIHLNQGWWFFVLCTTTATFCPQGQGGKNKLDPQHQGFF